MNPKIEKVVTKIPNIKSIIYYRTFCKKCGDEVRGHSKVSCKLNLELYHVCEK